MTPRQDQQRLKEVKELLFDIYRVSTGEELVEIEELVDALSHTKGDSKGESTYEDYIFQNN